MADVKNHLNEIEQKVMGSLKDFQRATVERIDYLYRHGQKRILVSDEVGLRSVYKELHADRETGC